MVARETSLTEALSSWRPGGRSLKPGQVEQLERFAGILDAVAVPRGLLGPREGKRIGTRHVLESLGLLLLVPGGGVLVDVGSGAGLPGIPLAIARSGPTVLVESQARRVAFLRETCHELDLDVVVVSERAEIVGRSARREAARHVTARAVAELPVALELALPLVRPGGDVILVVGAREASGYPSEVAAVARALGGADPVVRRFEVPGAAEGGWAMIVHKAVPTPERFPRRPGVPSRRPLGGGVTEVK